jgi:hypothetical protein
VACVRHEPEKKKKRNVCADGTVLTAAVAAKEKILAFVLCHTCCYEKVQRPLPLCVSCDGKFPGVLLNDGRFDCWDRVVPCA